MRLNILAISTILALLPTLAASQKQEALSKDYGAIDENKPVVCLLPGRVRKLGGAMTYLERRKPAKMSASECEIRGGEYTLYDRANYENALAVWREAADQGDATAQLYVGEIYEKGWTGEPDYATAAQWYAKSAAQGDRRAQRRLAYFYENGLGVEASREQALGLWRDALGLQEDLVLASEAEAAKSEAQARIDGLVAQLEAQNLQTGRLQRDLDEVQASLQAQSTAMARGEVEKQRLEQALAAARMNGGEPARVRELEEQIDAGQARLEEQEIAIALLEADVAAQKAQVSASMRRAQVRDRQLAKAQEELLAESARGDALLRELQDKETTIASLEQRAIRADSDLRRARSNQKQLETQLARASAAERAALQAELARAEGEVSEREQAMQVLLAEAEQQKASFQAQLDASKLREADLDQALARSESEKQQLAAQLDATEQQMAKIDAELAEARYRVADQQSLMQDLQDQLSVLGKEDNGARAALSAQIAQQQQAIETLKNERDELVAGWQSMEQERDSVRGKLSEEVDTTSWLNVELESANSRMAALRDELRAAELALSEANFTKQQLSADVGRLEDDLERARSRGASDRRRLEEMLIEMRLQLADASSSVSEARQVANRRASDFEYYGSRQKVRSEAASSARPVPAAIRSAPKGARKYAYRAIIIANYDYDYLPDLSSPPNDANELKQLLEGAYGFDVKVHINLDRKEMFKVLAAVREFEEWDSVLLYYVGHGRMDDYGDGYWLPTDYNRAQPLADTISSSDITQTMNQSGAKHLMVMADSCYSGALARSGDPKIRKSVPALMNYWMANKSRTVLTSGGLKPVMNDGPDKHSIFASALLGALESNGGVINGEMLHAQVYDRVRQAAAQLGYLDQKPQFAAIEDAGHENGQFVFLPGTVSL